MKILVCEDNTLASRAISTFLSRNGHSVETAADGNLAMKSIAEHNFDLIVVDVHMPYHSGLELVSFLRDDLKKLTPVIIVSAFSDPLVKRQAGNLGIKDYFVKPIDMMALLNCINSYS